MNILIVDDDVIDQKHLKHILLEGDPASSIDFADTVDAGLNAFKAVNYDVVLLDYHMPQRTGIEMLLELKGDPEYIDTNMAFVMMSGSDDEKLAKSCIESGAHDCIIKSDITTSVLKRAIFNARSRFVLQKELQKSYQKVKELAETDSLTKLANRHFFDESLKIELSSSARKSTKMALLLIDIDHFKYINDNHGHDIGDLLLQRMVKRIQGCLRGSEIFCRLGGDEFAITLRDLKYIKDVDPIASRIMKVMETPFIINNISVTVSTSIGISIYPDDSSNAEDILKHADIAMYRAKSLGRNQFCYFEIKMQEQFLKRYNIEKELRDSITTETFVLHYQPLVNPFTKALVGFEALIRWPRGDTLVAPNEFIPIAENSRLIIDIGDWIIDNSLNQLAKWNATNTSHNIPSLPSLAINLSPVQLKDKHLIKNISLCLQKHSISPQQVCFELTETALLLDSEESAKVLNDLSALGCKIALDDFGTGFSSISYLQNFPIDIVKIDKSLLSTSSKNIDNKKLLRALVFMIQTLELEIIAEGVESKEHLDLYCELGVNKVQGFFFSKALPVVEINEHYFKFYENKSG